MTNWKAMQVYGCQKQDFNPPGDVSIGGLSGGSWKANLHKDGVKYSPSKGGPRKSTMKATITIGPFKKDKIFNPVKIRVE